MPKPNDGVVILPGSLSLLFNLDFSGHVDNYLVLNVSRALVDKLVGKFAGTILQDTWATILQDLLGSFPLSRRAREHAAGVHLD